MLAAGTAASAASAAVLISVPVLAPALREEYRLSLSQVGVVLASVWVGTILTLLPWGIAADRLGESLVVVAGLGGGAVALAIVPFTQSFLALFLLLALAGAAGASVNSASGRAVMHWFGAEERGFALGLRQTAIPLGGLIAALALPPLESAGGLTAAFVFLAALSLAGAAAGAALVREGIREGVERHERARTLRDRRLWLLSGASGLFLVAQLATTAFLVLFLHDERGFSPGEAAAVLAAVQVVAVALRIGAGRWSDRLAARVVPLRRIGIAMFATLAVSAALVGAPTFLLVPALVLAGSLSMAWNGLSFTAVAELAGRARSGAAIGFQQTVLSLVGTAVPVVFAATVEVTSWGVGFGLASLAPLAGWAALGRLAER